MNDGVKLTVGRPDINKAIIKASQISDASTVGRSILTGIELPDAGTIRAARIAQYNTFPQLTGLVGDTSKPGATVVVDASPYLIYTTLNDGKTWRWYGAGFEPSINIHTRPTGVNNVNVGESALASLTNLAGAHQVGGSNTAVGILSLNKNISGANNSALGTYSLEDNILGSNNSAFGMNALHANISGSFNSAFGTSALEDNTAGSSNIAIGASALTNNRSGSFNVAIGNSALRDILSVNSNVAIGANALQLNVSGGFNTAIGAGALQNTSANNNVAIGHNAGNLLVSGTDNVIIGQDADVDVSSRKGCIVIGKGAVSANIDHALSIKATNLTGAASGNNGIAYLRIWLNGEEFRIQATRV